MSLIGAECTGKSTLATDIGIHLSGFVVPEVLRAFVAEHGRTPTSTEQAAIAHSQRSAELHALARHPWVVADPAPLMTAVYSQVYFHDDGLVEETLAWLRDSRLIVWCRPDFPWVPDPGQRDGPGARSAVDHLLASHVARLRARGADVIEACGTPAHRLAAVHAALTATTGPRDLD